VFLLYNILITLFAPIWVPWMLWRTSRRQEKPNWQERTGNFDLLPLPRKPKKGEAKGRVWIHAVSVGEVMAALPILRQTKALLPDHEIVLTVTTSSGHRTAREHAVDLYDSLFYFPLDVPRFQLAAMTRVMPTVVAVMETELWFNFLWAAQTVRAKTLLINGRISDRSFRRSRWVSFFYRALLRHVDRCLMQTEADAERIRALGGRSVEVFGNSKFDQAVGGLEADPGEWRAKLGVPDGLPVIVVGSTRGEEEERFVIEALQQVRLENTLVIHAPRHLERAPGLQRAAAQAFGAAALRSAGPLPADCRYLVLDTYGELSHVYALADVVVIGGGFENHGGQNLLQPLAHGKPVLHGPHMQNFKDVARAAQSIGASVVCSTPAELAEQIKALLADPDKAAAMGKAGAEFIRSNEGASRAYAEAIAEAARGARPS
jgi:3-deoxy-D-manno-octulosonic-acid transferase